MIRSKNLAPRPVLWLGLSLPVLLACTASAVAQADPERTSAAEAVEEAFETLTRKMPDGVELTIDVYRNLDQGERSQPLPVIICFHMSRTSRGEYREIAPKLLALGAHVIAVDLRHGSEGHLFHRTEKYYYGVPNETWKSAKAKAGREPSRTDSYPDMIFAVKWARELFPRAPVALLGSSFSATLVLLYGAERAEEVDAVIAFSPADSYIGPWDVARRIRDLSRPTYITCGAQAGERANAQALIDAIGYEVEAALPEKPMKAGHGSRSLLSPDEATRTFQWAPLQRIVEELGTVSKSKRRAMESSRKKKRRQ